MYAIIRDRGRQYKVKEGDHIEIDRSPKAGDQEVVFTDVLYVENGTDIRVGAPTVPNVKVLGQVLQKEKKGPKVVAVKFRKRESFRRKKGQRARHTVVKISKIEA